MPQFTQKMNIFPSISLETPEMCVETIRIELVFLRQLIWGVTCLGFLEKWSFSHLSPLKHHKCVLKPSTQGLFFWDNRFEGSHASVYSENKCFPIYLLRRARNVCCNHQNRAHFFETINLRGHMPRFTRKWVFSHLSPLKHYKCNLVEVWYSLEQYIGLKEDKLSSTTVDFIRSEGNLETKHLYWFSKPKMC